MSESSLFVLFSYLTDPGVSAFTLMVLALASMVMQEINFSLENDAFALMAIASFIGEQVLSIQVRSCLYSL